MIVPLCVAFVDLFLFDGGKGSGSLCGLLGSRVWEGLGIQDLRSVSKLSGLDGISRKNPKP